MDVREIKNALRERYDIPGAVLTVWTPPMPRLNMAVMEPGARLAAQDNGNLRTLHFYDAVDPDLGVTERDFEAALDGWDGDVLLKINSPGGSAFNGIAIMNTLAPYKERLTAHVMGVAASAATLPMMKASTRLMGDMATVLVHNARGIALGTAATMREAAERLESIDADLVKMYAATTKLTAEQASELMGEDRLMNAEEAVEKGFATGLLDEPEAPAEPENRMPAPVPWKDHADEQEKARLQARLALARRRRPTRGEANLAT